MLFSNQIPESLHSVMLTKGMTLWTVDICTQYQISSTEQSAAYSVHAHQLKQN